ncbi:Hypothetical predicted protein, partial [Pelobates cultripes]
TLVEYLRVKRIPRGMRLGIKPSFCQHKPKFEENWHKILNKCSLDLIALTIEAVSEKLLCLHPMTTEGGGESPAPREPSAGE